MANINKELNDIKNAVYGREVRGSIHDGIKKINEEVESTTDRQDSVEAQFQSVLDETTGKDVISAPEITAARVGADNTNYPNLKERLDTEHNQLSSQLAQEENHRFYESMINRKKKRRPMITIVDDDGNRGFYTKLRPLALEYGIVFTSAIITSRAHGFPGDDRPWYDRYIHYNEMLEMQKEGTGEFVSHTHHHDVNWRTEDMTEEERINDFMTSRKILKELGFNYRCVVYPFGTYTQDVVETARQVFDYAIGTGTRGPSVVIPPFDNYDMRRTHGESNMVRIKEQIDKAKNENGWVILTTHVDQGDWYSDEWMREIIEYALAQGLEFVTTEKGMEHHGNIAQLTKDDSISASGELYGSLARTTIIDHNTNITADTPIDYFKENTITHSRINAFRGGFPDDLSGFLETHRYNNDLWSYQKFTTTRDKRIYFRTWDVDNGKWNDFENYSPNVYLGTNAIKLDDPPHAPHLKRRNVYSNINRAGNEGFPENKSGTLRHYGFTIDGFARQEYHIYQDSKIYVRWWDGSKWSEFTPISRTRVLPINSITEETPVTDFDVGETITYVSVGNNFLGGKAGVVTTKVLSHNEPRYSEQEFKENGEFNKYIRHGQNDGSWGPWMKYVFEPV